MSGGGPADFLTAADEPSDEDVGFLTGPSPVAPEEPAERASRFGFRAGCLITGSAEETGWKPGICAGLYYRRAQLGSRRRVYELGLDYMPLEREDGSISSTLYLLRGEVLFGDWNPEGRKTSFYFLGGTDLISESAADETTGIDDTNFQSGINIGLGIGSTKGAWDLRAVYSLFPGSPNVKGNILVAAGVSF